MEREGGSKYGEVQGDGSTKTGCHELADALNFARTVETSLDSHRPGGTGAREQYSSDDVLTTMMKRTNPTTWQDEVTAN